MLQGEHSARLLNFIKLPFVIKFFILSVFEWPFYTGFTVLRLFCGISDKFDKRWYENSPHVQYNICYIDLGFTFLFVSLSF